jgi:drug/metabolite transporter (DMT)-like permease
MATSRVSPQTAAYGGIAVAVVAVSTSAILIKFSTAQAEGHFLSVAAGRMALSALLLAPLALTLGRKELLALPRKDLLIMVGIGAVLAAHFSLWIASLERTSVASSVVLVTSHPVLVAIVGHFVLKERLSAVNAAGIALGLTGVGILAQGDAGAGASTLMGDLLAFLGGVCAGVYILGGRHTRQRVSLWVYAFVVYSFCAVFLLVGVAAAREPLLGLPASDWWLFLAMALVPSILGHTMYNWSLKHVPAAVVSVSLLGEPIGSTMLAFLIFDEVPPQLAIVGAAIILVGIVLATWRLGASKAGKAEGPPPVVYEPD